MKLGIKPVSNILPEGWWNDLINKAGDRESLATAIEAEGVLVADALAAVRSQGFDFEEWTAGLRKERRGRFAGSAWAEKYGAILIPARLLEAGMLAVRYHVPLGLAINRLEEAEGWRNLKEEAET